MSVPVTIVIPVFNGRELLEKLLASIARQTVAPLEIIVVDNGSTDGAPDLARRTGARVIAMGKNTGFAAAVNRGIQQAKGDGIALINSDVELDSAWLQTLWTGACDNAVDFATGRILQVDGDAQTGDATLDGSFDLICRGGCPWRAGAGKPDSALSRTSRPIQFCSATAAIYHAELFRKVGLFEEKFESYLEDVDFGLRCASAGRKGGYFPDAVCHHHGSATFGRWHPRVVRLIARNQVFLIARHYPRGLIRRWLWPILVAQMLWGGLALRHGCGIAWLRGKLEAIGRFAAIRRTSLLSGVQSLTVESAIVDSERQIHHLQSATGFDAYWRLYFRLAGPAECSTPRVDVTQTPVPQITAVIVTYNSADEISACLDSVSHFGVHAIVIDNASTDGTVEVVRRSGALLIANRQNRGFAAAVNQGCSACGTPLVLLLNPDTVLVSDPRILAAEFGSHVVAAASGPLLNADGSPQVGFMVRRFPSAITLAFEVLGLNRILPSNRVNRHWRCMDLDLTRPCDVEQPAGAYLMIRHAVWQAVGGFDEGFYPLWFEDVDFCFRLCASGYRVRFIPSAVAKHTGAHSIRKIPVEFRLFYWYGSLLRYAAKHCRPYARQLLCLAVVSGALARLVPEFVIHPGTKLLKLYGRIVRLAGQYLISSRQSVERVS